MYHKLLFVTLLSASLISAMEERQTSTPPIANMSCAPRQILMVYDSKPLTDLMPPMRMTMDDYAQVPGDSWFHSNEEIEEYQGHFTSHVVYDQICENPVKNAVLIDTMVTEAYLRICSHVGSGCLILARPCTLAMLCCCRQSKNFKALRGITKTTQKTCSALDIFNRMHDVQTDDVADLEDKKNK